MKNEKENITSHENIDKLFKDEKLEYDIQFKKNKLPLYDSEKDDIEKSELTSNIDCFKFELNDNKRSYSISAKSKSDIPYMIVIPKEYNELPVTKIKKKGFSECNNLSIIIFEDKSNIKSIGKFAFYNCSALESIELPKSIEDIKDCAFCSCKNLKEVYVYSKYPPKLGKASICDTSENLEIYVEKDSVSVYKIWYGWMMYKDNILPLMKNISSNLGFFKFELNEDKNSYTVYARDRHNLPKNLVIPTYYNKKDVTIIGYIGFAAGKFESVILPEKLKIVGEYAFQCTDFLKELIIPDSVERIEYAGCGSSTTNYGYKIVSDSILKKIIFGENSKLNYIGKYAFWGHLKMTEFTIPKEVKTIDKKAIGANSIEYIDIPKGVESIEDDIFQYCLKLKKINVDIKNKNYKDIDGVLYSKDGTALVAYPFGRNDFYYIVPSNVNNIHNIFYNGLFYNNFRALYVNSVEPPSIPENMLYFSSKATKIYVPSSSYKKYINSSSWKNMKNIIYPQNIIKNNLAIKDNTLVQYVGNDENVFIPEYINKIQNYALNGCENLKNIYVQEGNKAFKAINGVLYNENLTKLIYYPEAKTNEEYEILESTNILGFNAFSICENLVKIKVHKELKVIEDYNFYYSPKLKEIINVDCEDNIYVIGNYVLYLCNSIEKAKFMSIKSIGKSVLNHCENLNEITFGPMIQDMPKSIYFSSNLINIFAVVPPKINDISYGLTIYVPKESVELYKASGWGMWCGRIRNNIYPLSEKIVQ